MRGNPKLRERGIPFSAKIIVRVSPAQEAMLVTMCEQDQVSVAVLMRRLIEEGAQRRQVVAQEASAGGAS